MLLLEPAHGPALLVQSHEKGYGRRGLDVGDVGLQLFLVLDVLPEEEHAADVAGTDHGPFGAGQGTAQHAHQQTLAQQPLEAFPFGGRKA